MPAECAFTLPSGKKCRCMATRNHAFCRHHGAPPSGRPRRHPDAWSRRACWRDLGRSAATMHKQDAVLDTLEVLQALRENSIADRTAGRLLRALLQRWDEVPLMPTPESGWVPRQPSPAGVSSMPPVNTNSRQPAAPAPPISSHAPHAAAPSGDGEMLTIEQIEQLTGQLVARLGANRP